MGLSVCSTLSYAFDMTYSLSEIKNTKLNKCSNEDDDDDNLAFFLRLSSQQQQQQQQQQQRQQQPLSDKER